MPIRSFALVVVLALASALGAARADDGVHAVGRVRPVAPGPTASVAASTGYGFTEELFGAGDAHHRALGALAVAVQPTRWLEVVGLVVGRYDRHTGGPGDDGWVGDPRVTATIAHHGASRSLGLRLGLWLPGADAPSIEPSAATVEASAVASTHGAIGLTASAGLRLDRSTETVDAAMLSPADRVGLGYSDADAILVGLGARHRRGPWTVLGEASAELLFGDDAPAMSQSPWRLGVGARRDLNRSLTVEALVEVGGSSRPSFAELPAERLIAIEPRLAIGLGLSWRPAPAAPRPVVVAPPPIDTPPPVDEPPPPTTGPNRRPGHRRHRLAGATTPPSPSASAAPPPARTGPSRSPEVALGDATVTIERSWVRAGDPGGRGDRGRGRARRRRPDARQAAVADQGPGARLRRQGPGRHDRDRADRRDHHRRRRRQLRRRRAPGHLPGDGLAGRLPDPGQDRGGRGQRRGLPQHRPAEGAAVTRRRRLAVLAIAAAIACGGKSDAPIARLLEGQGAVTREHTGKDAAAPIGQPFVLGDAARTGEASWARLELRGGAILRMGADSLVRFVPSGTRLERGEAGAEATAITVLTEAGPAIIEAGGRVRAAATADGQRVEVTVGRAIITRPDGEVALEPGGHLTVAIGGALIERVDRPAPTPPEPTPPPVAPVPPVPDVAAVTATVRGRGVTARTAGGPARALPAGAAELAPGDVVKLPRGASLEVVRGDGRATATGPAELTIGAADQPLSVDRRRLGRDHRGRHPGRDRGAGRRDHGRRRRHRQRDDRPRRGHRAGRARRGRPRRHGVRRHRDRRRDRRAVEGRRRRDPRSRADHGRSRARPGRRRGGPRPRQAGRGPGRLRRRLWWRWHA
jgi:hypothetical protein